MEFTRPDGDGASHSRKRRRLNGLVEEEVHRSELPPHYPHSNYCPPHPSPFHNGTPLGDNTFLDQSPSQPQKASTGYQDILRSRGSNHFQTSMYSPSHHDHNYRRQRPAAFSNGSIKCGKSPLDCPLRQPQKPSTPYQDIVRPGNYPQSRILSPSFHDHSYPPKSPAAFSNGSLKRDNSPLDWFRRQTHQSSELDMDILRPGYSNGSIKGDNSPLDLPLRHSHQSSALHMDTSIIHPGNKSRSGTHPSKHRGLSHLSQSPGTFTNGSPVGDNAHLDRPRREPRQSPAVDLDLC
ncbi:hypothetical protein B0H65DRAFT_446898 [Neurospora tetraspora]|uniref:Uncharacterized protein n=1 Tax=Neurospora tetraspora TaxID=94610 RepID=A0AAE0MKN6_9PEZI|nr:hypothetical protein B0H65DRAFT_446898 [Neurospora tetraspora]